MEQRINFVTLAVTDVDRSREFFSRLGWVADFEAPGEVLFIQVAPGLMLSLWERGAFAAEIGERPSAGLAPITLAHNCAEPAVVDAVLAEAAAAGATVAPAQSRDWGGYSGYFIDPDGFRWEVAHNPSPLGERLLAESVHHMRRH